MRILVARANQPHYIPALEKPATRRHFANRLGWEADLRNLKTSAQFGTRVGDVAIFRKAKGHGHCRTDGCSHHGAGVGIDP